MKKTYRVSVKNNKIVTEEENKEVTFGSWGLKEKDIEDYICNDVSVICNDDESLLIIGRQVANKENKRCDLIAIDGDGSLVIIEIKRDERDIKNRQEALESQSIRYCASLATIKTIDDVVNKFYAKYISKYDKNLKSGEDPVVYAKKKLTEFISDNNCLRNFNNHQRIILVSSGFDNSTLSACGWLINNGVDISVIRLIPIENNSEKSITSETIMPVLKEEDYYVEFSDSLEGKTLMSQRAKRTNLPRMDFLIQNNVVKIGDKLCLVGNENEVVTLVDSEHVEYNNRIMTLNAFGCLIKGWQSIQTYSYFKLVGSNKTLAELRDEKMKELGM